MSKNNLDEDFRDKLQNIPKNRVFEQESVRTLYFKIFRQVCKIPGL